MPEFAVDATGVITPTEDELLEQFAARQRAEVDPLIETHPDSMTGASNAIYGSALLRAAEAMVDLAAQLDPDKAEGAFLRAHCALSGTKPRDQTASTVSLSLTLEAGALVPAGSEVSVEGNAAAVFATLVDLENTEGFAQSLPVDAVATTLGPVFAPAGLLTVIETTVTGWTAVTNAEDAEVGLGVESPEELRTRRIQELALLGGATLDSIWAELLKVAGVTSVLALENVLSIIANGMQPNSFETVVLGGANDDIAASVWKTKPAGIQTNGGETGTVTDSQGYERVINFSRPTPKPFYIRFDEIELELGATLDEAAAAQLLVEAVETYTDDSETYLGVGTDVYGLNLLCLFSEIPGVKNAKVNISFAAIGAFDPALSSQILEVSDREQATLSTANIAFPS